MITASVIDIAEKVFNIAQNDFGIVHQQSSNTYIKVINKVISNIDIMDRKKFWTETFDSQRSSLTSLLDCNPEKEDAVHALKIIVKYCNLLVNELENEQNNNVLSCSIVASERSNICQIRDETLMKIREIRKTFNSYPSLATTNSFSFQKEVASSSIISKMTNIDRNNNYSKF